MTIPFIYYYTTILCNLLKVTRYMFRELFIMQYANKKNNWNEKQWKTLQYKMSMKSIIKNHLRKRNSVHIGG